VSKGKYDDAVRDAASARAERDAESKRQAATAAELSAKLEELRARIAQAEAALKDQEAAFAAAQTRGDTLQGELDSMTAINAQLRAELTRLGKDADRLLAEKGTLAATLAEAKARLEELRRAQAAAEARAKTFQELARKLKKMVDAGDLRIVLRDGRMVLELPNDVLFDTGKTDIKPAGKAALGQVAAVMKTMSSRRFQIAGHTDSVPIATARFPSNWELSTARAIEVVHLLVGQGVPPEMLSAAGFGQFDPVSSNDDATGRKKNRRTEIILVPNIDELVALPQ
jgi:chemotaxis protein MotB